jgi:hypothetical protein
VTKETFTSSSMCSVASDDDSYLLLLNEWARSDPSGRGLELHKLAFVPSRAGLPMNAKYWHLRKKRDVMPSPCSSFSLCKSPINADWRPIYFICLFAWYPASLFRYFTKAYSGLKAYGKYLTYVPKYSVYLTYAPSFSARSGHCYALAFKFSISPTI